MLKKLIAMASLTALLLVSSQSAFGAGFALYEWSSRGLALGTAMAARVDDASAVMYNPAAITQLEGTQILAGLQVVWPTVYVDSSSSLYGFSSHAQSSGATYFVPYNYATQEVLDGLVIGGGLNTRFGLGTTYEESWVGRYNVTNVQIQSYSGHLVAAYELFEGFSLGAGIEIMKFQMELENCIDPSFNNDPTDPTAPFTDIFSDQVGDSWGVGWSASLHYKLPDFGAGDIALGFVYRSHVEQNLTGEADFTKPAAIAANPGFANSFNDTGIEGRVVLPDSFTMGIMWAPLDNLSFEFDAIFTRWSSYKELAINYDDPIIDAPLPMTVSKVNKNKQWKDVWRLCFGVEYMPIEWLALRAGYVYDQSPITEDHEDYLLPSNDRHHFNFGFGIAYEDFTADFNYTYITMVPRNGVDSRPGDGVWDSDFWGVTHILGLNLGYRF